MSADAKYDGIVENLVNQFSSSLDCLRELAQNSIDAGTPRVEVWMDFTPGVGRDGSIEIHVDDFGEGMDEAVIDNQLTQLFASSKDNDLTKIGKFGIGFVSVFALLPRAVLLHTGRNGEYWEILFNPDRSFLKTKLTVPVEGTQITLFLSGDLAAYKKLVEDVPKTLRHWCSHSDVEITFEDRYGQVNFDEPLLINAAFAVEGDCMQHVTHQGTEIVVAFSQKPIYGFYNRGLTLALTEIGDDVLGKRNARYGHIGFKIKSRYLEHTLARETIMRDEQYEKAMALIDGAVNNELLEALVLEVEALVQIARWDVAQLATYHRLLGYLSEEPEGNLRKVETRSIIRLVDGSCCSLTDLFEEWKREKRVLMSDSFDDLSALLLKSGTPVVFGMASTSGSGFGVDVVRKLLVRSLTLQLDASVAGGMLRAGQWIAGGLGIHPAFLKGRMVGPQSIANPASIYFPVQLDEKTPDEIVPLLKGAERLLTTCKSGYRRLTSVGMLKTASKTPFFVVIAKVEKLMMRPPAGASAELRRAMEVAVNREHPRFQEILDVYRTDPEMGTYMLAKALLLEEDSRLDLDSQLMEEALRPTVRAFSGMKGEVKS